ncbi:beta-1,4-galactosyltransferase galt-1-like [Parasteatoda tepidariorum]|uniref:beta-1,4-galactosyltransferase galt-1-like n=1 Tax=Parasteatoda tepidariorum TaxID=114398 RepID=UPI00077FA6BF|nr:beta-1,4-galactosyltransferase galt-1-like [Parasteatoda tepidariorum]
MITQCLFSRLTWLSLFIVVTFIICITQEFTYILNLHSYVSTTNFIENRPPIIQIIADNAQRHSKNDKIRLKSCQNAKKKYDDWKQITDEVYAYSAFWEDRFLNDSFVRIIGGANISNNTLHIKCLFTNHSDSGAYIEASSKYKVLIEHHNQQSKAIYVICSSIQEDRPKYVTLVPLNWNNSWVNKLIWIKVQYSQRSLFPSRIGVCVRPLFNYTDSFHIAEFVAYYEALGIDRLTFYKYDISDDIDVLIYELQKNNYAIELLPWSLPKDIESMWALGQIASINDCIFRHSGISDYVVVVDLDEFITPRHVMNLTQLLSLHDLNWKHFSSFIFRSCVFCLEYEQDLLPLVIPKFITQTRIHRQKLIYPYMVRTKYIVKPEHVIVAGVHHVWELILGYQECFIPANQALVHHYRANLCIGKNKSLEKGVIDVMSRKYLNSLLRSKVIKIWQKLFDF